MSVVETPFFSRDSEMAALGAALLDENAARLVASLPDGTFADTKSVEVFLAIKAVLAKDEPVDIVTAEAALRERKPETVAFLLECVDKCPSPSNVRAYVSRITACAMRRHLRDTAHELASRAADTEYLPEETREWCADQLKDIRTADSDRLISMQDAAKTTISRLNDAVKGVGKGIPTGIPALDAILGGFKKGEMIVVGARPSVGKSILALTFCVTAAKAGKRVLLVSLEMNETEITERILANTANVPLNAMTNGSVTTDQLVSVGEQIGPVSRLPMWYCLEATTVERVRKAAYKLHENGGLDMIAVDYLQLMEAGYAKNQNRQEQISEISRGLRKLSMELNIPVIVLTQLNRSSETTRNGVVTRREPTMSEARESGAIEQDANVFILLHNPRRDEMSGDDECRMWDAMRDNGYTLVRIIVDKNRQGKRGRLLVAFDGEHMRFTPIEFQRKETAAYAAAAKTRPGTAYRRHYEEN